jgi:hypothetical protein
MKINTNSILILLGIFVFILLACISIALVAVPLFGSNQPNSNDVAATVQAIVSQTVQVITQNTPTSVPATSTPVRATSTPIQSTNSLVDSQYGTITGNLSYPSEFIPAMRVAAFSQTNGTVYFLDTAKGQAAYSINVPPGTYYVVSYPYQGVPGNIGQADSYTLGGGPYAGGYTKMVPCGLSVGCDDHALLPVVVEEGQNVTADPGDWYAPEGTFPLMPHPRS